MLKSMLVAVLVGVAIAMPSPIDEVTQVQALLSDPPAFAQQENRGPDNDGFFKADVVNVNKRVIVFVRSTQTYEGEQRRTIIRDTWMQSLNRSSPMSFPKETRKSVAVWFTVPFDPSRPMEDQRVTAEGQLNADMTFVAPRASDSRVAPSRLEEVAALLRWVHVAYYGKYDFVLFTDDDAFVSLPRLEHLCSAQLPNNHTTGADVFFYAGFVNSFEAAPEWYHHKYYAPFIQSGTLLISRAVAELIAREIGLVQPLTRYDATLGHFLMPFEHGTPQHIPTFVPDIKKTYEDVVDPIVVLGADQDMMALLNTGAPMPGQAKEMQTRGMFINPYPEDDQPECHRINGAGCNFPSLKMMDALP